MSLSFILVEPTRAANVGAAARAIKTMGFKQLILVASDLHLEKEAQWVAHGALDILENTITFDSLAAARSHFDLLVATTARERGCLRQYLTPEQLSEHLVARETVAQAAIVFGRESSGLSNDELALCDLFTYVPLAQTYPSLNLAQAVMVYGYALSQVNHKIGLLAKQADEKQLQVLKQRLQQTMQSLAIEQDQKLKQWLLDGAALLSQRDVKMAHQLLSDINKKIN
ncbi:tRNA/rRNA methyltransferase [Shewanella marina]|uniref:tRNA/rRNA methyltransferase n=1 Tax=Shewanella marina TaxID=487319 RepID=UPI000470B0EE|nr:tRNA/rRNA methyltransferase [Shewanella marina]